MYVRVLNTSTDLIFAVFLVVFLWIIWRSVMQTVLLKGVLFLVTSCFFNILGMKPEKPEKPKKDFPQLIGK